MSEAESISSSEMRQALAVLQQGVDDGLHYGAQLSVVLGNRRADLCVGEAAPGVPMTPNHVLCWSSSVKPVMSIALAQLQEQGLLCFNDPVAKYLPEFAECGKQHITLTHCLTHTAGLWQSTLGIADNGPPAQIVAHICRQPLPDKWEPGRRCGYDGPAWYILGGVVKQADTAHRSFERFAQEEIFAPLDLSSCSVGMEDERFAALSAAGLLAPIYIAPGTKPRAWKVIPSEEETARVKYPCPAGNGRGPARELASLYAALLPGKGVNEPAGPRLLKNDTVELITRTAREDMVDELQGTDTAWSLGFALRSILSGRHASERAFGHGGSQSSFAFADPERGLAVACLCNGKPGTELHYRRVGAVSTAIYEDLGLAAPAVDGSAKHFKLPMGLGTF